MNPFEVINTAIDESIASGKPGIRLDDLTNLVSKTMGVDFEPEAVDALLIGMSKMGMPVERIPYRERESYGVDFDLSVWKAETYEGTGENRKQKFNKDGSPTQTYYPLVRRPDPRAAQHESVLRGLSGELAKSLGPRNFEVKLNGSGFKTTITVNVKESVSK